MPNLNQSQVGGEWPYKYFEPPFGKTGLDACALSVIPQAYQGRQFPAELDFLLEKNSF